MWSWFRNRRQLSVGVVWGIALVFGARAFVNATPVADWIVEPLLLNDTEGPADAIVVPGAGVIGECVPNLSGTQRVLRAARLWRQGLAPLVVIAGGSGPPTCPVATAMARLARDVGVPDSRIRVETVSRSTRENGEFLAPLLRGWGVTRVLLVTDRLHMRRAGGVLEALGFTVERSAVEIFEGHPDNVSMLRAGLREFAALTYYWMRGWTSGSDPPSGPVRHSTMSGTPPAIAPLSGPVVVLGASYAQGWHLTSVAGAPVVNRGTSGQQSFELLERFERDVVQEKPRAVLIWGFINDIFRSPDGAMDATAARIRDSYTEMVRVARQHGITPVVATEVTARPRSGVTDTVAGWVGAVRGKEAYQDVINRHVLAMNRWLVEFATRERLLVLDFQAVLSEPGGRRRKVFAQPDGSHITAAGYDMLTSYAQPILEEFLRDR